VVAGQSPAALIDPAGGVELHEKAVPLNHRITFYDGAKPLGDSPEFDLPAYQQGAGVIKLQGVEVAYTLRQDHFAPGQFDNLQPNEQLSAPAFTLMDCGVAIDTSAVTAGTCVAGPDADDELIVIDAMDKPSRSASLPAVESILSSLAGLGGLAFAGLRKYSEPQAAASVKVSPKLYNIASRMDLSPAAALGGPLPFMQARKTLGLHLSEHPENRGLFALLPAFALPKTGT
jgi:hypothetical protein